LGTSLMWRSQVQVQINPTVMLCRQVQIKCTCNHIDKHTLSSSTRRICAHASYLE
jgi:hypothetical protein